MLPSLVIVGQSPFLMWGLCRGLGNFGRGTERVSMWVISKCSGQFFFLHLSSRHAFLYITADHRLNYRSHPLFSLVCDFSTARENMLSVKSALQCVSCLLFIFLLNPRPLVYHNHHKNLPDYSFSTPTHLSAHPLPLFFS